jgi:hypothetical protein
MHIPALRQKMPLILHARVVAVRATVGQFILFLNVDDGLERDIAQKLPQSPWQRMWKLLDLACAGEILRIPSSRAPLV